MVRPDSIPELAQLLVTLEHSAEDAGVRAAAEWLRKQWDPAQRLPAANVEQPSVAQTTSQLVFDPRKPTSHDCDQGY